MYMEHLLTAGTILDDRYRIDRILGQGGFGITYAAENVRIGLKVAIKELFWRGHSCRDSEASPEVALYQTQDVPVFAAQKDRFLREARILRDFSSEPGIVNILDYFEANGTAYIVMEYVSGQTLASVQSDGGEKMDPEETFRRFLPLIESLGRIHRGGVIHRDISPDNIIAQPDGSLKLIDFGAARQYLADEERHYTAISKVSYSPGEQFDKKGRQGPWTDVYALCATIYHCVTGTPPESAVQRMFLDELKKPSELGAQISPEYEAILMKGLQLARERRYQSMEELAEAIRGALPEEKPEGKGGRRRLLVGLLAGVACLAVALGLILYHQYDVTHKFRGVETESFRLTPESEMSAKDFAESQEHLTFLLDKFAGKDNYIMEVEGTDIDVTLPLEVFDGKEIAPTIAEKLHWEDYKDVEEYLFNLEEEIQANWEDPHNSLTPGERQVLPSELKGETMVFVYSPGGEVLTRGQRANMVMDFKIRLDALGIPYAFGTLYGNENCVVFRLSPERIGWFVLHSIGEKSLQIAMESTSVRSVRCSYNGYQASSPLSPVRSERRPMLRYRTEGEIARDDLKKLTQTALKIGEKKLYLQTTSGEAVAEAALKKPITNGTIDFTTFRTKKKGTLEKKNLWLLDYVDAMLNQTNLPEYCYLSRYRLLDEKGQTQFGKSNSDPFGFRLYFRDGEIALRETLQKLEDETGYKTFYNEKQNSYWIAMKLDADDRLVKSTVRIVPELMKKYGLGKLRFSGPLYIQIVQEDGEERCRVALNHSFDLEKEQLKSEASMVIGKSKRLAPYQQKLVKWWNGLDEKSLGVDKKTLQEVT